VSLGSGDASASAALDAHIEQNRVTITFVTLICTGPCADVVAVPTGGQAPYTFAWDNGSTSAARHVCPTSSTNYSVKVTDTGTFGELARPPETVQVPLTANVIACPDGGPAPATDGGMDVDAVEAGGACADPGDAPWSGCMTVTVGSSASTSWFGMWCTQPTSSEPYSWTVCLPHSLHAGQAYSVKITYAIQSLDGPVPQSGVSGSTGACSRDETLVPLQGWPILSPYFGTFSLSSCVTTDRRYPQLLHEEVQQTGSGYVGDLTFEICNGCTNDP
jgi:hypothetical protein